MSSYFNDRAHEWWNEEKGPFVLLHQLNPLRLTYILEAVQNFLEKTNVKDLDILDIGCGGGIVCEPLARLSAYVTGIDESAEAIFIAENHKQNLPIRYISTSLENLNETELYDIVLAFEVIEHVTDPQYFITCAIQKLKPGGIFILSTLARNIRSYLLGIVAAEYVLRWVPKGTHEWKKFLNPSDIAHMFLNNNLNISNIQGYGYNPFKKTWTYTPSPQVNYLMCGRK